MSKYRKRPWNLYKFKNSFLQTYLSLIIEYGMYLKCLQKSRFLSWFKTSQALSILLNFPFPFVSFIGVFSILKCRTLILKTFTKVSNPFLPSRPKWLTWRSDVCGGVGYGWFYWFSLIVLEEFFSQTSLELEFFSPTYNGVRFFYTIVRHERYFFQCRIFFSQEFSSLLFSSRNQSAGHFFWNHP